MNQDELVARVAEATKRQAAAAIASSKARDEEKAATDEVMEAWRALRDYQDGLVAVALGAVAA